MIANPRMFISNLNPENLENEGICFIATQWLHLNRCIEIVLRPWDVAIFFRTFAENWIILNPWIINKTLRTKTGRKFVTQEGTEEVFQSQNATFVYSTSGCQVSYMKLGLFGGMSEQHDGQLKSISCHALKSTGMPGCDRGHLDLRMTGLRMSDALSLKM